VSIKLWSINRWLRWVGLRVFVRVDDPATWEQAAEAVTSGLTRQPTEIGILWGGLPGSARWKRWSK
jgi:hypothetical protein